jgi:hypothetical protein
VHNGRVRVTQRRPAGFLAIPALFAPVAVCGIPGHTSSGSQLSAEVAVLALVVGVVGFESTVSLGLIAAGTSLLSLNGFAEDSYGQLGWHPGVDLRAAAVIGRRAGAGLRRPARRRPRPSRARGGVARRGGVGGVGRVPRRGGITCPCDDHRRPVGAPPARSRLSTPRAARRRCGRCPTPRTHEPPTS